MYKWKHKSFNESFKSLDIKLNFNYTENFRIRTYKGEFAQVILESLNNAKMNL